jgi:antitoxin component YwqK of YwqJK toxin-antitoxin module
MNKILLIILALFLMFNNLSAQKIIEYDYNLMSISCQEDGILEKFIVCNTPKEKYLFKTVEYAWFYNDGIHYSHNNHSGRLLHGLYTSYYQNNNIKSKGEYFYGMKDGTWHTWNDDGTLLSITSWKKGIKDGSSTRYYSNKKIYKELYFKDDKLHGEQKIFNTIDTICEYKKGYKHGEEIIIQKDSVFVTKFNKDIIQSKDTIVNGVSLKEKRGLELKTEIEVQKRKAKEEKKKQKEEKQNNDKVEKQGFFKRIKIFNKKEDETK